MAVVRLALVQTLLLCYTLLLNRPYHAMITMHKDCCVVVAQTYCAYVVPRVSPHVFVLPNVPSILY